MAGLNSQMVLDTQFLEKFSHLPDELIKAARRAVVKTNHWLRAVSMAELGFELQIDSKAMKTRFRVYKNGRTSKLWVGVREIGVHRFGTPVQTRDGVEVAGRSYKGAWINPLDTGELLVWRRNPEYQSGKVISLITEDIRDQTEAIIESYQSELNRKFEENFHREFQFVLSGAK